MRRITKRIIAGILCGTLLLVTGCSGGSKEGGGSKSSEKGRYLESERILPEEVNSIQAVGRMEDGTLRVLAGQAVYDSSDEGETWDLAPNQVSLVDYEQQGAYVMDAAIDSQGRIFLACDTKNVLVDANGEEKEINIDLPKMNAEANSYTIDTGDEEDDTSADESEENGSDESSINNMLYELQFTSEDKLLGKDFNNILYLIDVDSGEIIRTFENIEAETYTVVGSRLVVLGYEGIEILDFESGNVEEVDPALRDYFANDITSDNYTIPARQISAASEDSFYYADTTGLYRYTFGTSEMELLINGGLCSLGNPVNEPTEILELKDNRFLMFYRDNGSYGESLKYYEYDKEASATPEHEIKVYALNDSNNLRAAIANFQSANPDCYVNLEIGMSGEDGVTASDAISTLNTNIMAGNGPDILYLEGLPSDSYIEKGLLADLSDIVEDKIKTGEFFENILTSLGTEDGTYAVPTKFSLPIIEGNEQTLNTVSDLDTLAEEVKKLRNDDQEIATILGGYTSQDLLRCLLNTSLPSIVKADGTMDETALKNFLEKANEIYQVNAIENDEEMVDSIYFSGVASSIMGQMFSILLEQQAMNLSRIESFSDLQTLGGLNSERSWSHQVWSGQAEKTFIPIDTVGVNAKSDNMEISKDFVKYLLSDELQANTQLSGLPLNQKSLDKNFEDQKDGEPYSMALSVAGEDGVADVSFQMKNVTAEEFEQFKDMVGSVETAVVDNAIISEAIVTAGQDYLTGNTELSEAVDGILKTVNLHLAEK